MGQKVHPLGFRLGVIRTWSSVWYAGRDYAGLLHEDLKLREYIKRRLYHTGVAKIDIERAGRKAKVHIYTARPGLVIGQRGAEVDKLRYELEKLAGRELLINIHEVLSPEISSQLVAESIASQLERRVSFRRAMKKAVQNTMRLGAKGIRLRVAGRLNGAEIARVEQAREGSVPLHTLRADVDYGFAIAYTTYGTIGVKCWIYLGDVARGQMAPGVPEVRTTPARRGERSAGRAS
ncbi:MAG: 30S ribosomal protein S3 [Candidatus Hydrogenedentes bacterium]|nr:30S ribosomal protein S3 [Candidatus Hydrogenedentota bacterium]